MSSSPLLLTVAVVFGALLALVAAQHPDYAHALRSRHPTLANPAVVDVSVVESQLPAHLMRASQFYRNPKTADALAQSSWFTDKEMPVLQREADRIPREQVFKLIKNSGLEVL